MSHIKRSCKFIVQDDALLIASNGHPFSRLGVVAICASHLGTKHEYKPTDPNDKLPNHELLTAIRDREIRTYQTNPDRITSDYRGEEETRLDYGGRAIWELLQNADDSLAPSSISPTELIGAKGIGFKSVLEISDEPEIHSGPFHFYFSSNKTMALLKNLHLCNDPPAMTFRIPFEKEPDKYTKELLGQNFTVIRLPFRDGKKDFVIQTLAHFDSRILLFCQYLEELQIIFSENDYKIWKVNRENPGKLTDGDLIIEYKTSSDADQEFLKYRRWVDIWDADGSDKQLSVSFCLPLNKERLAIPAKESLPLHVFFPTNEIMPFHVLMHASFDLEQNRNHIRKGDFDDSLLNGLGSLLERMVSENISAETMLKAFVPLTKPIENSLAEKIWKQFKSVLQKGRFIPVVGGQLANPLKCQIWNFNLGRVVNHLENYVIQSKLVSPEIQDDAQCREALKILEAQDLDPLEYAKLLFFCNNNTFRECLETLKSLYQIICNYLPTTGVDSNKFVEECRDVVCWWKQDAKPRSLSDTVPLFKKPPRNEYPEWLPLEFLEPQFLREYEQLQNDNKYPWGLFIRDYLHDSTNANFLNFCLLPELRKNSDPKWWDNYGRDVLKLLQVWVHYGTEKESIWEDDSRVQLGQSLLIPSDKGWMPAIQCYAGKSWDGLENFDQFFANISERGVILDPGKWPIKINIDNIDSWKKLFRFVGVSWELKLIHWEVDRFNGWPIKWHIDYWKTDSPFNSKVKIEQWNQYWKGITPPKYDRITEFDWDATVHKQWAIEYFPDALPMDPMDRLNAIIPIAKQALSSEMHYTHEKKGYYGRTYGKLFPSFAHWQLRKFPWLPCKPTLFHANKMVSCEHAYMPGKGLKGLLPEVNVKIPEGQDGRDLETFLTQDLKVREELPPPSSMEWKKWLKKLSNTDTKTINEEQFKKIIRIFFKSLLNLPERPVGLSQEVKMPAITWRYDDKSDQERETLLFLSPKEIYWLDKHYFAEPKTRSELIRRFNIFLMELNEGQKAREWFELKRLSEFISITPEFDTEDPATQQKMLSRYKKRYHALSAISKEKILPDPSDLKLNAVENLKLVVLDGKTEIATPKVTFWKGKNGFFVEASTPWRGLGHVLSSHRNIRQSDFFENILKAESLQEVLERLREHGISDALLHDLEENGQQYNVEDSKSEGVKLDAQTETPKEKTNEEEKSPTIKDHRQNIIRDESTQLERVKVVGSKVDADGQARRKKGKDAEEWIREVIEKKLDKTWKISTQDRDDQGRESDIVIRKKNVEIHFEVKHMEAGAIYWSQKEVSKAQDNIGSYFMVICCPEIDNKDQATYREYWLLYPLENLIGLERSGCWLWQNKEHVQLTTIGWDVPEVKPSHEANNFSFYIKISEDRLKELSVGNFESILEIIHSY